MSALTADFEAIALDRRRSVRYVQELENTGLSLNVKTVLYVSGLVRGDTEPLSEAEQPSLARYRPASPRNGKNRVNDDLHLYAQPWKGRGFRWLLTDGTGRSLLAEEKHG